MAADALPGPGDHYQQELEEHLDEYLVEVFHVEAEDGSPEEAREAAARRTALSRPPQVSTLLVHVFEACAAGDASLATQLAAPPAELTPLEKCQRDESDARWTLEHGPGAAGAGPPVAHAELTADELADAMGGMAARPPAEPEEPVEEGWERVPSKPRRSGRTRPVAMEG